MIRPTLLTLALLVLCSFSSEAQTLADYIRRYDGGPAISYYRLDGTHVEREADTIPIHATYGGASMLYSFYLPLATLGPALTAGIEPALSIGAGYSPAARAFLFDVDVPLVAMVRSGAGAAMGGTETFGFGVGVGYRFFLIGTSLGAHEFLLCGTQGPVAALEVTQMQSEQSALKLRLYGSIVPIGISLDRDDRFLTSDFTGDLDFTCVTLSLGWTRRF